MTTVLPTLSEINIEDQTNSTPVAAVPAEESKSPVSMMKKNPTKVPQFEEESKVLEEDSMSADEISSTSTALSGDKSAAAAAKTVNAK